MPLLRTERTTLRPWEDADADRLLDLMGRWEVSRWLDAAAEPMADRDAALAQIADWRARNAADDALVALAVDEHASGRVAGSVLLSAVPDGDGEVEIGWYLHPDALGRGLATEAAAALLAWAFDQGLDRVHALMYVDNHPSFAVAERIGLRDQGVIHDQWYPGASRHLLITAAEHARNRAVRPPA
jgi:RimJ/RimL family protein N-acetyltransferase